LIDANLDRRNVDDALCQHSPALHFAGLYQLRAVSVPNLGKQSMK
jgi:hypothetical protein